MIDLDVTFFLQLLNFLITLLFLNFVLFRPIRGTIRKRAELMADKLRTIESFATEAEKKLEEYNAALDAARIEAQSIRVHAREAGRAEESALLAQIGTETAETISAARNDIAKQRAVALHQLQSRISAYAKEAAGKILSRA